MFSRFKNEAVFPIFRFLLVQITEEENKFSRKRRIWGNCIKKSKARSEFQKSINAPPHAATTKASILSPVFFKDGREETSGEISDIPSFPPFSPRRSDFRKIQRKENAAPPLSRKEGNQRRRVNRRSTSGVCLGAEFDDSDFVS